MLGCGGMRRPQPSVSCGEISTNNFIYVSAWYTLARGFSHFKAPFRGRPLNYMLTIVCECDTFCISLHLINLKPSSAQSLVAAVERLVGSFKGHTIIVYSRFCSGAHNLKGLNSRWVN